MACYGGKNAKTPNLDKLAQDGMRFQHCYNAIAMCVPTRNMLYTGLFPMRTGSYRNHTNSRPGTVSMVSYFHQLGYRVGLSGKTHFGPPASFPFESIPGLTVNCTSPTDNYSFKGVLEFMTRNSSQPFVLVTGFIQPHVPWTMGDPSAYDTKTLQLPPHWADTPETRECYQQYLAEVTFLDKQVGELLGIIDETGLRDNTVVVFLSEQGAQFPGAKWTCWEQGLHAGALVRWPGKVKPGSVSNAMIQYVDFVPTFLDIARSGAAASKTVPQSGNIPAERRVYDLNNLDLDGRSFIQVLLGETEEHGKYAFGIHNNEPEGPPYPIRSVRTKDFAYIRNLTPEKQYVIKFIQLMERQPYYTSWRAAAENNDERAIRTIQRNEYRPAEELYDLRKDPYEMNNLADAPEHRAILAELRTVLDEWMKQQGDPGAEVDVPPKQQP